MRDDATMPSSAAIIVGSLYGLGGMSCLLAVRYPMSPDLAIGLSKIFGIAGVAMALLLIGLRRRVTMVMLNAALVVATVMASVLVSRTGSAVGVVLPSVSYMCIVSTAAYFFRPSLARAHAWLAVGGFTAGVLASGVPSLIVPWFMVTVTLLGTAEMLHHLVARLRQEAALDPLTGLANRAYFRLVAEREIALAGRGGARFSVALIDLDNFKAVNDTYGHGAGDTLLTELAAAWQAELRRSALLARYGGDEFALIMPDAGRDDAVRMLERLRGAHRAQWSAGVATWDDETDLRELMERADHALYLAKNTSAR